MSRSEQAKVSLVRLSLVRLGFGNFLAIECSIDIFLVVQMVGGRDGWKW